MEIIKNIPVPTGNILIVQGDKGKLEMLSIGDYGKDVNLKADFLGLSREPNPVKHQTMLPLSEKWVITISTQYGCNSACTFCDVPKVGPGVNATFEDLVGQFYQGILLHPEVEISKRINLHYARMGEPTWNETVIDSAIYIAGAMNTVGSGFHPVVSTMMPTANPNLKRFLERWIMVKNDVMLGEAGLQISINSTDEIERNRMFRGSALMLHQIGEMVKDFNPIGRKITLNFCLGNWVIDPTVLKRYFDPSKFLCKLTPLHRTRAVEIKGLMSAGDWTEYTPYAETESALKDAGYDVIVFLASKEEDESRITCGNAILSDL